MNAFLELLDRDFMDYILNPEDFLAHTMHTEMLYKTKVFYSSMGETTSDNNTFKVNSKIELVN